MKPEVLHIEARKKFNIKDINFSCLNKIPGKAISLASTIQYIDLIPEIKNYLKSIQKKVIIKQGPFYKSHVLGCYSKAFDKNADSLLLLADGKFHALNNAVSLDREIYIFNTQNLEKIEKKDIEKIKSKTKAKIKKFLTSENIGILVSTKPGQYKDFTKIKQKIEKLGKKPYVFESDSISLQELENFNLPIYINTACPGLGLEDPRVLNLQDVLRFI